MTFIKEEITDIAVIEETYAKPVTTVQPTKFDLDNNVPEIAGALIKQFCPMFNTFGNEQRDRCVEQYMGFVRLSILPLVKRKK